MTKTEQDLKITEWLSWGLHNGVYPELLVVAATALRAAQEGKTSAPLDAWYEKLKQDEFEGMNTREVYEKLKQDEFEGMNTREVYEELRKESVIFATGNKPEDGASQTARGLVHSMPWDVCKPDAEEWMEAVDALIPTAEAWMEAAAAQGKYEPRDAKSIMLDEWLDSDTREQSIQAAKALHPLLLKKTPRKNNKKR